MDKSNVSGKEKMKLEEKIDAMRRKVLSPIYIRGISKCESFESEAPLIKCYHGTNGMFMADGEVPAYIVDPMYDMNSLAWTRRLQATVHAASWRALEKCQENTGDYSKWVENCAFGDITDENLPAIMVFGCPYTREYRLGKRGGDLSFDTSFSHLNDFYESSTVHGDKRLTFRESMLITSMEDGKLIVDNPKLFEVGLGADEMRSICKGLNDALVEEGTFDNLYELERFYTGARNSKYPKDIEGCAWAIAKSVAKTNKLSRTPETSPHEPAEYLIHLATAQALTNKFTGKLVEYVNALPELILEQKQPALAS
jgi:hypothetical protein